MFCLAFIYYSLFSGLWPMLPFFLDYSLLITLCVLFNLYLLQSVQCVVANVTCVPRLLMSIVYLLQFVPCVVANVTCVPRLLIVDYPLCFVERVCTTDCSVCCGQCYLCSYITHYWLPSVFCRTCMCYSLFSVLRPMLPVFLDYSLLITLCVLSNVYVLQTVQCVVANVTCVPILLIVDYPLCFV